MGRIKDALQTGRSSPLRSYQDVILGTRSPSFLLRYELTMLLANSCPGALGLVLRQRLYPGLFARVGRGTAFGRNLALRSPRKIALGEGCVVDDNCALDGGSDHELGIALGDEVMLARNVQISSKGGTIRIGRNVGVGANSELRAIAGNVLEVGDDVILAPSVYLGGTRYRFDRTDIPIAAQGFDTRGGVRVGSGAWLGAGVVAVDGVTIGRDAVVAAGSVVVSDLPDFAVAAGVPAKVLRIRSGEAPEPFPPTSF